ncbi:MAG TPA: cobyrinate a,c-diamide synthase [Actinospica sp.]|nr:cobyrinate a,c-diamide synthase [Actinospica sp.]HWG27681.1 cobyrinate a,c-diamide synthase [Actinospica sp.]
MSTSIDTPRVVIAAPASGHGKTTVATGLIAAFARRGRRVAPFKVGPDYIDPGYHALAAGRPGRNLDPFLVGESRTVGVFAHGAAGADIAVVEGVMGLYDGAVGRGEFASTAQVATLIGAPVILVVDATAQGRSVAALVDGFRGFDRRVRIAGVVLNRVGSDRHREILAAALDEIGVPLLGTLHRSDAVATPSRHLGLVPVAERAPEALATVDALADLIAENLDLDRIERIAGSAPAADGPAWSPEDAIAECGGPASGRPVVAVAGGAAFTFSYAEHAELLQAAGAEVVTFDPLRDAKLPERASALVIGGGFPEVYASELAQNLSLMHDVQGFAQSGGVIAAECAGLLYLAKSLNGERMCDLIAADAVMSERLTLGYREAVAATDSVLCGTGTRVNGHEFHRTKLVPAASDEPAWMWRAHDGAKVAEGYASARLHASYLHLHWAGAPELPLRVVTAAAKGAT